MIEQQCMQDEVSNIIEYKDHYFIEGVQVESLKNKKEPIKS